MIRTILHPSGEVRELPPYTLATYAPHAIDHAAGTAVESMRYIAGKRVEPDASPWPDDFALEYPTSQRGRAEEEERWGPGALGPVSDRGSHLESELWCAPLGELCMVHLGELDARGRRIWRLARREVPRPLLDEADAMLAAAGVPTARELYEKLMLESGVLGWALRCAANIVERAGRDATPLWALRKRCHEIVGHEIGS